MLCFLPGFSRSVAEKSLIPHNSKRNSLKIKYHYYDIHHHFLNLEQQTIHYIFLKTKKKTFNKNKSNISSLFYSLC